MARRSDLRQFQEDLARRIASADRSASAGRRLAFRTGGLSWLVALPDAGEVLPVPTLTSVPLTRGWLRGMANVRGNLYTVTDLAALVDTKPVQLSPRSRLLLVGQRHGVNAALLVELVLGLRDVTDFVQGTPDAGAPSWVRAAYQDRSGVRWRELNVTVLLQASQFLDVAA